MSDTFVVVGGDAAGMSAASKARREDPSLEVVVLERGEWVSYGACGLPYYVKGEIDSLDDLVSLEPDAFREERGIDLRTGHEVLAVDPEARTVTVEAGRERYDQGYDALLISTGARAIEPPFDGMDLPGVFTFHDMETARAVRELVEGAGPSESPDIESVAVIGGGYVGVEMAEAFRARGLAVSMLEMLPTILQPFGTDAAEVVADHLREQGVDLRLETRVTGFDGDGWVERVDFEGGSLAADLVVVGVGVAPNVGLAEDAGIELGETGAIATDAYGRTSAEGVYAAGDCAEATHVVTGEPDHVPLALTANRAGRAIGSTVAGRPTEVGGIAGTAAVKAFDLEVARTGLIDEDAAREAGFDPASVTIEAGSRAHYYPGGSPLQVTMVGDRASGRLLGASLVGREGAVHRIDAVATALEGGLTVREFQNLDLAYAPPFAPVWDPLLTAAKVLSGRLD